MPLIFDGEGSERHMPAEAGRATPFASMDVAASAIKIKGADDLSWNC